MSELLDELRKVQRLGGDTYSSAEVIGLVGRAADEIERLRAALINLNAAIDAYWNAPHSRHRAHDAAIETVCAAQRDSEVALMSSAHRR